MLTRDASPGTGPELDVQVKEVRVGMVAGFDFNSHVSVFRSCRAQERGENGKGGGGMGIGILYIKLPSVSIPFRRTRDTINRCIVINCGVYLQLYAPLTT
jgi:hypothetical protein